MIKHFERGYKAGTIDRKHIEQVLASWRGRAARANVPHMRDDLAIRAWLHFGIDMFDKKDDAMIFGEALERIKAGRKVKRKHWYRKSVYMGDTKDSHYYLLQVEKGREPMPYTPANDDIFADDWLLGDDD